MEEVGKSLPDLGGPTIDPGVGKPLLPEIGPVVLTEDGGTAELGVALAVIEGRLEPSLGGPEIDPGLGMLHGTVVYWEG